MDATNGRVGIGTAGPTKGRLVIAQTDGTNLEALFIDSLESTFSQSVLTVTTSVTGADNTVFDLDSGGNLSIDGRLDLSRVRVLGGVLARGGAPGAFGLSNNGYAFAGSAGDNDSGMFSEADNQVNFYTNATEAMRITDNVTAAGTITAGGLDLAENFLTDDKSLVPGEIVGFDPFNATTHIIRASSVGSRILGVVSTDPGLLSGYTFNPDNFDESRLRPVALSGRVPVKVSTKNGNIFVGDWLSISSQPGVARRADPGERAIGYALEPYSGKGIGEIKVFINLAPGTQDLQAQLQALKEENEALKQLVCANHQSAENCQGAKGFNGNNILPGPDQAGWPALWIFGSIATVLAAVAAALALSAALATAQTGGGFDLSFSTTEAGATSTGGGFSVNGTAGQPDAVTSTGGAFSLQGGFLGGAISVATPTPTPTPAPEPENDDGGPGAVKEELLVTCDTLGLGMAIIAKKNTEDIGRFILKEFGLFPEAFGCSLAIAASAAPDAIGASLAFAAKQDSGITGAALAAAAQQNTESIGRVLAVAARLDPEAIGAALAVAAKHSCEPVGIALASAAGADAKAIGEALIFAAHGDLASAGCALARAMRSDSGAVGNALAITSSKYPEAAGKLFAIAANESYISAGASLAAAALIDSAAAGISLAHAAAADPIATGCALSGAANIDASAIGQALAIGAAENTNSVGHALASAAQTNCGSTGKALATAAGRNPVAEGISLAIAAGIDPAPVGCALVVAVS
ncbi:MAG: hypothetical protein MK210_15270 [Dehalococcoidia bacterium]|nr:hypothetical protein [Dehalococcoidia bacterium]